jgi:hypothetical protein
LLAWTITFRGPLVIDADWLIESLLTAVQEFEQFISIGFGKRIAEQIMRIVALVNLVIAAVFLLTPSINNGLWD